MADSWPGLLRGQEVIEATYGLNLPIAGFAQAAHAAKIALNPILWCAAEPSGPVTGEAFDAISDQIIDGIRAAGAIDGVYFDLHGAMITESHDDGEGELLSRVRAAFGANLPIAISLDLHANISQRMVDLADVIAVFRTYPHLDMSATGARCLEPLTKVIGGTRARKAFRRAEYLVPPHAQFTGDGPLRDLYALAARTGVELALGFTSGDTVHTGPACVAFGATQAAADAAADKMIGALGAAEPDLDVPLIDAKTAVAQAMAMPQGKPIVLADVEDNPGGGGSSDTTGLLKALIAREADGAILGLIHDPSAAAAAHRAGIGSEIELALGGRSGCLNDSPLVGRFRVEAISDGQIAYEGEMYGGGTAEIGRSAALGVLGTRGAIRVVVSSVRNQCLDRAFFRHFGLAPEAARLICVKSTVHYRADFDPISQASVPVANPGALASDLTSIRYQNLRKMVRLGPMGPRYLGPKGDKLVD